MDNFWTQMDFCKRRKSRIRKMLGTFAVDKIHPMDWQNILIIVIAVLLLLVWVPALIISVRRTLRKDEARHSGLDPESETETTKNHQ